MGCVESPGGAGTILFARPHHEKLWHYHVKKISGHTTILSRRMFKTGIKYSSMFKHMSIYTINKTV